jgi:hypothetical protein
MDQQKILKQLRVFTKSRNTMTSPTLVEVVRNSGQPKVIAKLENVVKLLDKRIENLEFAYEMLTKPVREPQRTLTR